MERGYYFDEFFLSSYSSSTVALFNDGNYPFDLTRRKVTTNRCISPSAFCPMCWTSCWSKSSALDSAHIGRRCLEGLCCYPPCTFCEFFSSRAFFLHQTLRRHRRFPPGLLECCPLPTVSRSCLMSTARYVERLLRCLCPLPLAVFPHQELRSLKLIWRPRQDATRNIFVDEEPKYQRQTAASALPVPW